MEKKLYISPEVMVVALRPCSMLLEGSIEVDIVTNPDDTFDPTEEGTVFSREGEGSSNNSIWDNVW